MILGRDGARAKPNVESPLPPFAKGEGAKRESDKRHSIGKHTADMRPVGMRPVGRPRQAPPLQRGAGGIQ